MSVWSAPPPRTPPPLETHFLEGEGVVVWLWGVGGQKCRKNDPPPFWVKNHESYSFFHFEPKNVFGSQLMGLVFALGSSKIEVSETYYFLL